MADYAVASYQQLFDQKRAFGDKDFVLFVYMNCLSTENKKRYQEKWSGYPYTVVYDNAQRIDLGNTPFPGQVIVSPEGIKRQRDDYAENYDELWSTELVKFTTPFVATVDADFEMLHTDFYFYLIDQLQKSKKLIGASTSHDITTYRYDTYSKRNIVLNEGNHTWFCIYKKQAFDKSRVSHFYYEEAAADGSIHAYDSAAYFQEDLRRNHKLSFAVLPKEYHSSFVHYGAGSKNVSLTRENIGFYRRVFLWSSIGFIYVRETNPVVKLKNKGVRKIAGRLFHNYLNKYTQERSRYIFDQS